MQVHAGAHGPIFVHQDVHETGKTAGGGGRSAAHLQLGTPLKVTPAGCAVPLIAVGQGAEKLAWRGGCGCFHIIPAAAALDLNHVHLAAGALLCLIPEI